MRNKGFLLILSLVIISIILSIGLGVFFIIIREFQLASYGRDSQIAFHAADSGIECAMYWDIKQNAFDLDVDEGSNIITCNEQNFSVGGAPDGIDEFDLNLGNNSCVHIEVDKIVNTIIEARGYMPCDAGSTRKVERGIRMTY